MKEDMSVTHKPKLNIKLIILGILISICFGLLFANAPDTLWTQTFGGAEDDRGYAVDQTSDGGYIIAGATSETSVSSDTGDICLIKTDENGNTKWSNTYGDSGVDKSYSVKQTSDGGYIIAGSSASKGNDSTSFIYLIKTDTIGHAIWKKKYCGATKDVGYSVLQTFDYGYAIVGVKGKDIFLMKVDSLGNHVWTKSYGGADGNMGYSLQQTSDSGFVIVGCTDTSGGSNTENDVYIIRTEPKGDTLWTKTYGGTDDDYGYSIDLTSDGGYIIAGYSNSFGNTDNDVYLLKTDERGDTTWAKTYGGADEDVGHSVERTSDGGYIIAGYTGQSIGPEDMDVLLIKTDEKGDTMWTGTYGGSNNDWGYSVQQTIDGGYIIAGYTDSYGMGGDDIYLIKTKPTKLVSPDGGEQLTSGSTHDIKWWCEHPKANYFCILFSSDGGANFADTIANNIDGDSTSWTWTVPDIYIGTCRIKIQVFSSSHEFISEDESNGNFTIGEPGVSEYEITDPGFMNIEGFPNPFKELTDIKLSIGHGAECIELEIYDVTGREVKKFSRLMLNALQPTLISWDGRDRFGNEVSSGVYLLRFEIENCSVTKKLLLIR